MQQIFHYPSLLTVEEVALAFRLTRAAIRRMIRAKEIPAIKIGKEYRIPEQVVKNLLNPLTEQSLTDAAFGLWKGGKYPSGPEWVHEHRKKNKKNLDELLEALKTA